MAEPGADAGGRGVSRSAASASAAWWRTRSMVTGQCGAGRLKAPTMLEPTEQTRDNFTVSKVHPERESLPSPRAPFDPTRPLYHCMRPSWHMRQGPVHRTDGSSAGPARRSC